MEHWSRQQFCQNDLLLDRQRLRWIGRAFWRMGIQHRISMVLSKGRRKKTFFLESFPKCVNPPTHPRIFVRFGKTKGEIRVKNCGMIWLFWGGPCLGISHPTHPHSGKLSQKSLFLHPPSLSNLRSCWVGLWDVFTTISSRISMSEELQIVDPKHPFYIDIFFNLLVFYNCGNKTAVDLRKRVGIY